jgi:hypothetical protein
MLILELTCMAWMYIGASAFGCPENCQVLHSSFAHKLMFFSGPFSRGAHLRGAGGLPAVDTVDLHITVYEPVR